MASAMRKMAVYLGLVEDDHRYGEKYDSYEEYEDYVGGDTAADGLGWCGLGGAWASASRGAIAGWCGRGGVGTVGEVVWGLGCLGRYEMEGLRVLV